MLKKRTFSQCSLISRGRKYFYGDIIDEKLVGNNYSVWSFTAGVLQKYNEPFTDVGEMLRYTAANAGGASFGKIRNCTTGETCPKLYKASLATASAYSAEVSQAGESFT